ncbi:MAG: hypothetical protein PHX24_09685, partial [Acidithiobacillus sp.]|nr:hypothetical protein [Acidithiobacillus sp.]
MPSIDDRMRKRFILMNSDAALRQEVESSIPEKWEMTEATDLDAFDEWQEILLHRFMLLNLEDPQIS